MKVAFTLLGAVVFSAFTCEAGYLIQSTTKQLDSGMTTSQQLLVEGLNLRAKMNTGGQVNEMIFFGKEGKVWNIIKEQRQVMEMTAESGAAMGQQLNAAMKEMQEQMANMPPEQRAMMEKMMGGSMSKQGAPAKAPTYSVKKTGNQQEIEGISCRQYDFFKDGVKHSEIFAAPWSKVDAGPDSIEAMNAMGRFMTRMIDEMKSPFASQMAGAAYPDMSKVDGYPLLIRTYEGGVAKTETLNKAPVKQEIPAAAFELPEGYQVVDPAALGAGL